MNNYLKKVKDYTTDNSVSAQYCFNDFEIH